MSSVIIAGDTSGSVTLQAPATAGSTVVNLPSTLGNTGTSSFATTDASGNLGLGVTPSAWNTYTAAQIKGASVGSAGAEIQVSANAYYNTGWKYYLSSYGATRYEAYNGYHAWYNAPSGTAGATATFTQAMTLDASGNLALGTTSSYGGRMTLIPAANPTTASASTNQLAIGEASVNSAYKMLVGYINIGGGYAGSIQALAGGVGTNLLLNADGGNVLVGTTSVINSGFVNILCDANTKTPISIKSSASAATTYLMRFVNNSGTDIGAVQINGTNNGVNYTTASDYRLKENIQPMTGALAKVAALNPCTYTWKDCGASGQGFIAHELQEVVPECVSGEKDAVETYIDDEGNEQTTPKYQGIDTSHLVATLTAAIKEQQAIIQQLQADVAALKGQ